LSETPDFKCGTVALLGRPNVGKSTLVNALVGHKVSIVSDKAQTTRRRVLGILTEPGYQIVFIDTPGIHEPHTTLGRIMVQQARGVLSDADVLLAVVDVSKLPTREDETIALLCKQYLSNNSETKLRVCMNKMDLMKAIDVKEHVEAYWQLFGIEPDQGILTCFTKRQNLDLLQDLIVAALPEQPARFAEDEFTDQPMRFIAAESVREKVLQLTRQEVPHAVGTVVEQWEEMPDSQILHIAVAIVVEKDGQKGILIGKKGEMLKKVGTMARIELEEMLDTKIYLELRVKVRTDWRQNPRMLRDLEYDQD